LIAALNKFFYDTANSAQPYTMGSFTKVISISQLLFGTDFPYAAAAEIVSGLAECGFSEADLRAIDCENAYRLIPRLKHSASNAAPV
jgi:6-methylsalicylate decarboxylase